MGAPAISSPWMWTWESRAGATSAARRSTPRTIRRSGPSSRSPSTRPTGPRRLPRCTSNTESCWRWAIPCTGWKTAKHPQLKDRNCKESPSSAISAWAYQAREHGLDTWESRSTTLWRWLSRPRSNWLAGQRPPVADRPIPEVQQVNLPALKRSFATSGSLSGRIKNFGGAHVWYPDWNIALACTATGSGHSRDDSGLRCAARRQLVETFGHRKERITPSAHVENNRRSEERRVGKECRSRWSPYH